MVQSGQGDLAAILFTSGSTGAAKGVLYTHSIFRAQSLAIKEMFSLKEGDIDLAAFPLFGLFSLASGASVCFPDMNPAKPARANPKKLIRHIKDLKITCANGSPAIWKRVANFATEKKLTLPGLEKLIMFGAPVSNKLHLQYKNILVDGTTYTPYGATESLPISLVSARELFNGAMESSYQGRGTCVGHLVPEVEIKIIAPHEERLTPDNLKILPTNQIGEILVSSPFVTPGYFSNANATSLSKYYDGERLWHRMGDMGYLDDEQQLWFCGRKSHSFLLDQKRLHSTPIEGVFYQNNQIDRCALIPLTQNGEKSACLVVEETRAFDKEKIEKELLKLAKENPHTQSVSKIVFYKKFPVDPRHNIKIDREKLAKDIQERM